MRSKTTISLTEARKKIFEIAEEVQTPGVHYTVTEKGRPKAVFMSFDEFESWMETLEVIKDFPDLEKDIKEAEKEFKKGQYVTLDELLFEQGYVLADKGKEKYAVRSRNSKKSPKRNK